MIVATPDISTARFGFSPMITGNTNVAPNIATTCCAPRPAISAPADPLVRPHHLTRRRCLPAVHQLPAQHRHRAPPVGRDDA